MPAVVARELRHSPAAFVGWLAFVWFVPTIALLSLVAGFSLFVPEAHTVPVLRTSSAVAASALLGGAEIMHLWLGTIVLLLVGAAAVPSLAATGLANESRGGRLELHRLPLWRTVRLVICGAMGVCAPGGLIIVGTLPALAHIWARSSGDSGQWLAAVSVALVVAWLFIFGGVCLGVLARRGLAAAPFAQGLALGLLTMYGGPIVNQFPPAVRTFFALPEIGENLAAILPAPVTAPVATLLLCALWLLVATVAVDPGRAGYGVAPNRS